MTVDERVEQTFGPFADVLSAAVFFSVPVFGADVPVIVVWLMAAAIFLTVWLRFQPITAFKHSLQVIRGRYTAKTDPGEVSTFQALATELSGTVGLGNIAGVAVAIAVGGPGAALWIAIFGLVAMSVKMAEATLGVKYRRFKEDGSTEGGPMYYLRDGLREIGLPRLGKGLAVAYAVFTLVGVFGAGNLFQANQVAAVVAAEVGSGSFLDQNRWVIGVVMAVIAGAVILGGITSIARWTSVITPLMAVVYVACALIIIAANITALPAAIAQIIGGAFNAQGVAGGAIGVAIVGIQRALFSNAAGVGSAGMAHSAVKTRTPATEGFAAMWEPFIDSVIICSLTAITIVITGVWQQGAGDGSTAYGVALTSQAFGTVAAWFPLLLTVAVVMFGFSTVLSYAYYGELSAAFLFGRSRAVQIGFRIVWVLAVIVGASVSLASVVAFSDAMFFLMSVPNLLGIYFLARILRMEILRHRTRVETGVTSEVAEDLRVGLRDHEPTAEQAEREQRRILGRRRRLRALQDRLDADPDYPSTAESRREDRARRRRHAPRQLIRGSRSAVADPLAVAEQDARVDPVADGDPDENPASPVNSAP